MNTFFVITRTSKTDLSALKINNGSGGFFVYILNRNKGKISATTVLMIHVQM